jgi:4-diphosphocytidyl-2-C-methyl-D-erythritol kinase
LVTFPNCKINLGLHIVEKRSDGYHNLETVFYPLPLTDVLEIITDPGTDGVNFTLSGLPVAGDPASNLCVKAWQLLKKEYPQLPGVKIHLHKKIPMGAGLGGGSSDGASTLLLLNQKYNLGIPQEQLAVYALKLGSDCPFFIYNKPALGEQRGEKLTPLDVDLSEYSFLIVNPALHISTAQAFTLIQPAPAPISLVKAVAAPIDEWRNTVTNDFEAPAFAYFPELKHIKSWLYKTGALYASMTGSGSCFYGIFPKNKLPDQEQTADTRWDLVRVL